MKESISIIGYDTLHSISRSIRNKAGKLQPKAAAFGEVGNKDMKDFLDDIIDGLFLEALAIAEVADKEQNLT